MGWTYNPFTGKFDYYVTLENPVQFKGVINVNSDFPTSAAVKSGWYYVVETDVTDNDGSKTNTGLSFEADNSIMFGCHF